MNSLNDKYICIYVHMSARLGTYAYIRVCVCIAL